MSTIEDIVLLLQNFPDSTVYVWRQLAQFGPALWRQVDELSRQVVTNDDAVSTDFRRTFAT